MPTIAPPGGEVDWPADEGVLGIVGVAPWATIDFLNAFYGLLTAHKDWHFPRVVTDINTKLPSRGRYFELGETDPSPAIAASIEELHRQGATLVVVPCNTAHLLHDRWGADAAVPIPHIVRETVEAARRSGVRKACPFVSRSLSVHDLYGRMIEDGGLACRRLVGDEQDLVSAAILEVKQHGRVTEATVARFDALAGLLQEEGVAAILLGCTELSRLPEQMAPTSIAMIDSNEALARAAARKLGLPRSVFEG